MNTDRVVVGDLYFNLQKTGTYIFLKIREGQYVRLDDVESILDISFLNLKKIKIYETTGPCCIDKESIRPYFPKTENKSLKKIKNDYYSIMAGTHQKNA